MMGLLERVKRKARTFTPRPVVLMYHRVATPKFDPWDLSVSPANFEDQIRVLKAERTLLPLTDYTDLAKRGDLPADAVAITFDDGYRDNREAALPVLKKHGAPMTLFLSTGFVGSDREYWWDELARMMLGCGADPETHLAAWGRLKGESEPQRQASLAQLRKIYNPPAADPSDLPMTVEEVRDFAAEPLVTIGAHSVTHAPLNSVGADQRAVEIRESRKACEDITGAPVTAFAYPYGDMDEATRQAVADAGFAFACTTEQRSTARRGQDPFRLPRMSAPNVDGETLLAQIKALP